MQRECEVSFDDVRPDIKRVVLSHQSRRHINAHYSCRTLVDISHKCGKTTGKRFVDTRAEQTVNNQVSCLQCGRIKLCRNLHKALYPLAVYHALPVCRTVVAEPPRDIEEVNLHVISLCGKHPRDGECVASVVTRSGKDYYRSLIAPPPHNSLRDSLCSTFH